MKACWKYEATRPRAVTIEKEPLPQSRSAFCELPLKTASLRRIVLWKNQELDRSVIRIRKEQEVRVWWQKRKGMVKVPQGKMMKIMRRWQLILARVLLNIFPGDHHHGDDQIRSYRIFFLYCHQTWSRLEAIQRSTHGSFGTGRDVPQVITDVSFCFLCPFPFSWWNHRLQYDAHSFSYLSESSYVSLRFN